MEALKKEADATGYAALVAEAGYALARHLSQVEPEQAEKALLEAAKQAVKAQDWALEAEILLSLLANYGRAGRVPESLVAARVAELAVERAHGDDALRARLATNTGSAELNASHTEEALRYHRLAQELSRKALGARSPALARARQNTGTTLMNLGRTHEALSELEGALAIQRAILRPDHPDIADTLDSLGQGYINLGHLRKARDTAIAALAIRSKELGPEHVRTTYSVEQAANAESRLGNFERAFSLYESLLATQKRVLDEHDVFFASTYLSMGDAQRRAGYLERAERNLRAAVDQCARAGAPEHGNAGHALASLGLLHNSRHQYALALRACRQALDILSHTAGPDSSYLIETRECLGEALLATGDIKGRAPSSDELSHPRSSKTRGHSGWRAPAFSWLARSGPRARSDAAESSPA